MFKLCMCINAQKKNKERFDSEYGKYNPDRSQQKQEHSKQVYPIEFEIQVSQVN